MADVHRLIFGERWERWTPDVGACHDAPAPLAQPPHALALRGELCLSISVRQGEYSIPQGVRSVSLLTCWGMELRAVGVVTCEPTRYAWIRGITTG